MDNMSFESLMDLRNIPLLGSSELFPKETLEKAVEKSSRVLHDEAIWKAVSLGKLAMKSAKKLHSFPRWLVSLSLQNSQVPCPPSQPWGRDSLIYII